MAAHSGVSAPLGAVTSDEPSLADAPPVIQDVSRPRWTRKQWEDWETWEDTMRPSLEPDQMNLMQMPGRDGAADEGVSGDALSLALSPAEQQALHDAGWPLVGVERLAAFCDFLDWARGEFGVGAVAWALDAWGDALVMGNTTIELAQETLWERLRDVPVERPEDDGRPPTTVAS